MRDVLPFTLWCSVILILLGYWGMSKKEFNYERRDDFAVLFGFGWILFIATWAAAIWWVLDKVTGLFYGECNRLGDMIGYCYWVQP